jgi:GTP cyclohydrolase I
LSETLQRDEVASGAASISEVMRASAELNQRGDLKDTTEKIFEFLEEEYEGQPIKPSYIEMGRSIMKASDLEVMKELG